MDESNWTPTETSWNDSAYQETRQAFPDDKTTRGLALCLWCYARDADTSVEQIENWTSDDAEFDPNGSSGKKITVGMHNQARKLLGLPPLNKKKKMAKASKQTRLSKPEKAMLARFQKSTDVFETYNRTVKELAAAQEAVEMAQKALHDIPREHITTMADVDPDAAELFRTLGLFEESSVEESSAQESSVEESSPQVTEPPATEKGSWLLGR